jgi:hypothetical protein
MTVAVQGQQARPKRDALDIIQAGLQAAQAVYGIKADMAKMDEYQAAREDARQKFQNDTELTAAQVNYHNAQADALKNPRDKLTRRDVKYTLDGKPVMASLLPSESIPANATPYEEPKAPKERKEGEGGKFTRNDPNFWDKTQTEYRDDKQVVAAKKTYYSTALGLNLLKQSSSIAESQLATLMNKFAEDESAPSGDQIKKAGASEDAINLSKSAVQKALNGQRLTDTDKIAIGDVIKASQHIARSKFINATAEIARAKSSVSDLTDAEILREYLKPSETLAGLDNAAMDEIKKSLSSTFRGPSMPGGQGTNAQAIDQQRKLESMRAATEELKRRGLNASR